VGSIAVLAAAISLFLYARRHRRASPGPLPISTLPFLKSPDGSLYFRLDRLDGDGMIIGRGQAGVDLRIDASTPHVDTVSNRHARIYYDVTYGNVIIEDLSSSNGVFINGRQAPRKNLLKDGWVVSLGSVTLKYHDGESDTGPLE
jgi:pSer/pThr/pTyr-binding forkhead associated (FHA) protein